MLKYKQINRVNEESVMFTRMNRVFVMLLTAALLFTVGCGSAAGTPAETEEPEATAEETEESEAAAEETEEPKAAAEEPEEPEAAAGETLRIGSLKGPTTMGLVNLMKASDDGLSAGSYSFTMETQPDVLMASLVSGDIDIALIPANMASVAYNKTQGAVAVLNINTLGVLYAVTADESVKDISDLAGRDVLLTGQGATPEYALNYLLSQNGVTDCRPDFRSEATEIAAVLQEDPMRVAILPEPFVTVAEAQNDSLITAFSLTDEWDKVSDGSRLLTGVTVVRRDVLESSGDAVRLFEEEQKASVAKAGEDIDGTAELIAQYGIIEKAPVAKKALPGCQIVCLSGEEMKAALSGYLEVLFESAPESVGGGLPGDDFYIED